MNLFLFFSSSNFVFQSNFYVESGTGNQNGYDPVYVTSCVAEKKEPVPSNRPVTDVLMSAVDELYSDNEQHYSAASSSTPTNTPTNGSSDDGKTLTSSSPSSDETAEESDVVAASSYNKDSYLATPTTHHHQHISTWHTFAHHSCISFSF